MNDKEVTIVIRANSAQFQAALNAVKDGMNSASGAVKTGGSTIKAFASQAGNAFGQVADQIAGMAKVAAATLLGGSFGAKYFIDLAGGLQTTQRQMAVLTGSTEAANKVFGELYNYTLGKPIAFPDASKAAQTLIGYGRTMKTVQSDMETISKLSIVNGADLQSLAVVYGQVTSRGALFGQDALQLINNNIPLTTILAKKFGITMEEASEKINGGKVSAAEFVDAMKGYSDSLDISSMSDTFKNRMISLQGTIRSVGLAILGVRVDSQKGLIVDQSGLFAKLIDGISEFTGWLKENKNTIIAVANVLIDNAVPALAGLTAAFLVAKAAAIGFALVANTNPFMLIAYAIAAVVAGLVYLQLKFDFIGKAVAALNTAFQWVRDTFESVKKSVMGFTADSIEKFRQVVDNVSSAVNTAKDAVVGFVKDGVDWLQARLSELTNWVKEHEVAIRNWAIVIGTLLLPKLTQLGIEAAKAAWSAVTAWAQAFGSMAAGAIRSTITMTIEAVKSGAAWVKNAALASYAWVTQELPKIIAGAAKAAIESAKSAVLAAAAWIKQAALTGAAWAKTFALYLLGVGKAVAQTALAAIRMAASWLLAMGPIGLIVALVIGIVALIIANWDTVKQWFATFWEWLSGVATGVWSGIQAGLQAVGDFFKGIWATIQGVIGGVIDWVKANWPLLLAILTGPIGLAVLWIINNWETVKAAFALAWQFIQNVWGNVAGFFQGVWNGIVNVFAGVGNWFANIFTSAVNAIRNAWGGITGFFQGIWNGIVSIFGSIGAAVSNGIVGAVRGVVNGILSGAEGIVNGFVNAINGVIGTINKIPGVNIGKLGTLHLPRLATGGIVSATPGGQNITVAEGGQDEWVVPESKMASLISQVASRASGNGGGVVIQSGGSLVQVVVQAENGDITDTQAVAIAHKITDALRMQGLNINEMGALR